MDAEIAESSTATTELIEIENERTQEELANMLRMVIANFCDQHFVKHLQKARLAASAIDSNQTKIELTTSSNTNSTLADEHDSSSNKSAKNVNSSAVQISNTTENTNSKNESTNDGKTENETNDEKSSEDANMQEEDVKEKEKESVSNECSEEITKTELDNEQKVNEKQVNGKSKEEYDEMNNSNMSLSPPSSTNTNYQSSVSNEKKLKTVNNLVSTTTLSPPPSSSYSSSSRASTFDNEQTTNEPSPAANTINENEKINKLPQIKEVNDEYLVPSSKLWSTILIGADKLEIFGSIHVRSNNVRLLSCLIDEQLSLDNSDTSLSFSSAASITSSGSCSSKLLFKTPGSNLSMKLCKNLANRITSNSLISKPLGSSRKQNFCPHRHHRHHNRRHNKIRRLKKPDEKQEQQVKPQQKSQVVNKSVNGIENSEEMHMMIEHGNHNENETEHADDFITRNDEYCDVDYDPDDVDEYQPNDKQVKENGKTKKACVDSNVVATSSNNEMVYQIKKFKAYHHYCDNKRKMMIEEEQKQSIVSANKDDMGQSNQFQSNLTNLADVAVAEAMKMEKPATKKSRKSTAPCHSNSEPIESEVDFNEDYIYEDDVEPAFEDNSSMVSRTSYSRCSSMSSVLSEPINGVSSRSPSYRNRHSRRARSSSSFASSSYDYDDYHDRSYSSSSYDYDNFDNYETKKSEMSKNHHSRKTNYDGSKLNGNHHETDKQDKQHESSNGHHHHHHHHHRRKQAPPQRSIINDQTIEQEVVDEHGNKLETNAQMNESKDEKRRDDEYLMRKYKRRFMPYNSNTNQQPPSDIDTSSNLYLLASSRQHHRMMTGDLSNENIPSNKNNATNVYSHNQKLIVDRLSPISDPDMEKNQLNYASANETAQKLMKSEAIAKANGNEGNDINMLNRLNNLSPSSSSSSSSSLKQQQLAGMNGSQLSLFHHSSLHSQQHNPAAAVLAAAAAAAAADLRNIHPHHQMSQQPSSQQMHGHHHHHHHAQSVAALLADMQQQQQQQQQPNQDVAKAIASFTNGSHHLNHQHLLNRFSGNNQSELMAAVLAQQQQQQQQHRAHLESPHHGNNFGLNSNGQLYSRYSSHINAAVAAAAAAAAAASSNNTNSHRR
jgi:hypothetical protein